MEHQTGTAWDNPPNYAAEFGVRHGQGSWETTHAEHADTFTDAWEWNGDEVRLVVQFPVPRE